MASRTLWHYTCAHGREAIGESGVLLPACQLVADDKRAELVASWWPSTVVWLTDLRVPLRAALGLTSVALSCDRTAYRYRVLDPAGCVAYTPFYRRSVLRAGHSVVPLENVTGVRPRHWWVSTIPVPVEFDPAPVMAVRP